MTFDSLSPEVLHILQAGKRGLIIIHSPGLNLQSRR